tara:strand:+ start:562 stop:843 length:282 start_codon:yes stop_codon:yes gene_type:complete
MSDFESRASILVSGTVQGVFYRASTMEQAQQLDLVGTVMNLGDGSVEIVVEGRRYAIEELITWCRLGPPAASVSDVLVRWDDPTGEFNTFRIQ